MGFKSKEQLADIITGGAYRCGVHDFVCDITDTEAVRKHESDLPHTVSGTAICQRCKGVKVSFKNLPKPKQGLEPGAFCDDCKAALKKELFS